MYCKNGVVKYTKLFFKIIEARFFRTVNAFSNYGDKILYLTNMKNVTSTIFLQYFHNKLQVISCKKDKLT